MSEYVTQYVPNAPPVAAPTTAAQAPPQAPPVQAQEPAPAGEAAEVSDPAAVTAPKIQGSMARVEYRDQNGKVLDENLVASLRAEGKVKFETRYDAGHKMENAHEVPIVDGQLAPPHPDVEGQNPETGNAPEDSVPPESPASVVDGNERSVEKPISMEAKPASEGNDATK